MINVKDLYYLVILILPSSVWAGQLQKCFRKVSEN